jgi:hypothetical protein
MWHMAGGSTECAAVAGDDATGRLVFKWAGLFDSGGSAHEQALFSRAEACPCKDAHAHACSHAA